ncbi:PREDICTED: transcription factor bHLH118-like isoform X2 [Nicotiana attenuata]|uniref:Transcription factor bhlh125 n=1 Tax=Nicotiana attenuata TaxID=49451 RepID=A0A1J6KR17_NICAT|nr:PREDICTED: transcription factor bHLH118-like isoform X2 [Nicotiana attenuata]OIT21601.1 transcription factor bhlh125 [Nicotiana attenuata]
MMDNFHSFFPFQQNEDNDNYQLLYPPTNTNSSSFLYYQEDSNQLQDLVTDLTPFHSLEVDTNNVDFNNTNVKTNKINKRGKKSQNSSSGVSLPVDENTTDFKQKKIIHREIERQRRQEMSNLYASLRQLLPLEYLKGKRSTSDHILEAVNYIEHLQEKVRKMEDNKGKLKMGLSSSDVDYPKSGCSSSSHESSAAIITVKLCLDGMEILTDCSVTNEGFYLSRVLEVLLREGLSIVSCSCNKVNGRLLHTIRTEVCSPSSIDAYELQKKLAATINSN